MQFHIRLLLPGSGIDSSVKRKRTWECYTWHLIFQTKACTILSRVAQRQATSFTLTAKNFKKIVVMHNFLPTVRLV